MDTFNQTISFADINQTCFSDGSFYDCSVCQCALTDHDLQLNVILSGFSTMIASVLSIAYFFSRSLRKSPGDIIFAISTSQFAFALCWLILVIKGFGPDYKSNEFSDSDFCQEMSFWTFFAKVLFAAYNLVFFFYILKSIANPLKSASASTVPYHIVAWVLTLLDVWWRVANNGLGMNMYGGCEDKTTRSLTIPILYLIIFTTVPFFTFYKARTSLPRNEKMRNIREQFLNYYTKYIAIICFLFVGLYVNEIIMIEYSADFTHEFHPDEPHGFMRIFRDVGDLFRTASPFVITFIRFSDPMIKQHTKKVLKYCTGKKKSRKMIKYKNIRKLPTNIENLLDESEGDSNRQKLIRGSFSVEMDTQNNQNEISNPDHSMLSVDQSFDTPTDPKAYIEKMQRIIKTQLVYSLLSSFHYFWKKSNHSPIDFQKEKAIKGKLEFLSELHERYTISDHLLRESIPEVVNQIKDERYYISNGLLTIYSPKIFSCIAKLDDQDEKMIDSLDLKNNFENILKAGVNGGGKSGEFFFFSYDNKLIIKTVSDRELKVLLNILPDYIQHFTENPFSMIAKIYGAFTFETSQPYEKYNLILMRNLTGHPSKCVERKYDLKGSTFGRVQIKGSQNITIEELKTKGVLKDLDFNKYEQKIWIDPEVAPILAKIMEKDSHFMREHSLVDYSLAIMMVNKKGDENWRDEDHKRIQKKLNVPLKKEDKQVLEIFQKKGYQGFNDSNFNPFESLKSTHEDLYYHMGIIDYLIDFGCKKRLEVFFKKLSKLNPNLDISVQHPNYYASRFANFMKKILAQEQEQQQP